MEAAKRTKLGAVDGVYIPVCLNIFSILMFLRFGLILGQVGLVGMLGLLLTAYLVDYLTTLSLSAIASNGEVKGGGAYYLISRSLGPEFGGSIGVLFYLAQVLNTALNVVGLIDCIKLNVAGLLPSGYWAQYLVQTASLIGCAILCLPGSGLFAKASNVLLVILGFSIFSIPISAVFRRPFVDDELGIEFTGVSAATFMDNILPHTSGRSFNGYETFSTLFGILFPATSGIFAGASMSGDLRNPSKAIPKGTLWAMLTTFLSYLLVIFSLAASVTHSSFLHHPNIIHTTSLSGGVIFAGEIAVTFFSALMGLIGAAKLLQAMARDKLLPGMSVFGQGTARGDEPIYAIFLTYLLAQVSLLANLNQIATLISMGYQLTFFVMNLACFLLKIGSAPNFRPAFRFFSWQTAFAGSLASAGAMFFIDETYAATAVSLLVCLFLLIHYLCPPKKWGDVSQNLIYHQVRKYLLRLKPEHIKFWRPQIILLVNNPRRQTRLIQFCNSMKKGALYILGHVIVTDDFGSGVQEAKLQQTAWTNYISEVSRLKAFVQLNLSPSIVWGVRNLILSAGLGGMRPNIAVLGFYNLGELRSSEPGMHIPEAPMSPVTPTRSRPRRRRGDTSARIQDSVLPTDVIRTENMMSVTEYMTILEDLALRYRLNVAVGLGFQELETPSKAGGNTKKYIDLWPIQMSAEVLSHGKSVLTTNFDTYTLILQLGYILHSVPAWKRVYKLRVLVFVEYESEVAEERARVKALLDKLRIEAEILVFWLASGDLKTYELIINGRCNDESAKAMVNDALAEEDWWADLRSFRNSSTSHLGVYNAQQVSEEIRRRPSVVDLMDIHARPTMSRLSRLGVNIGIHTTHITDDVLEDTSGTEIGVSDDEGDSSSSSDVDFEDRGSAASEGDMRDLEPSREPLLGFLRRRKSHGDVLARESPKKRSRSARNMADFGTFSDGEGSGAMSSRTLTEAESSQGRHASVGSGPRSRRTFPTLDTPDPPKLLPKSPSTQSLRSLKSPEKEHRESRAPSRPTLSRQSSAVRFSSQKIPETRITVEDASGPTIMFADSNPETPSEQPQPAMPANDSSSGVGFPRTSTGGWFSSRPVPETRISNPEGVTGGPTITFAEPDPSFTRTRQTSTISHVGPTERSGAKESSSVMSMPELLRAHNYKVDNGDIAEDPDEGDWPGSGASYATQGIALSFNDLPSRAQHLILNELMRKNSADTAVLFSTLPIPAEGTCEDEAASVQYLSDVEVLCAELPPVLLVLSNNMTVTVSL